MITVKLRYTGSALTRRVIDDIAWEPGNDHMNDAPLELAADLLTGRESAEWALAEKPRPSVLRKLAEEMGGVLPELILIPAEEPERENEDNG